MQRRLGISEKVLPQHGKRVTTVTEAGRDLPPLTQVAWLHFSRPQDDDPQALPLEMPGVLVSLQLRDLPGRLGVTRRAACRRTR